MFVCQVSDLLILMRLECSINAGRCRSSEEMYIKKSLMKTLCELYYTSENVSL